MATAFRTTFRLLSVILALGVFAHVSRAAGNETPHGFVGITLIRATDQPGLLVIYVATGSPASWSGLVQGDFITSIDGVSTRDLSPFQAVHLLGGEIHTRVVLTFHHPKFPEQQGIIIRQSLFDTYRAGAAVGESPAESALARAYRHGLGTRKNDREAFDWYYAAAAQGSFTGEYAVGEMYEKGIGVPPDLGEALNWYQKSLAAAPDDTRLKMDVAVLGLKIFMLDPMTGSLDLRPIRSAFGPPIAILYMGSAGCYLLFSLVLIYFQPRSPEVAPRIWVAIGWMVFYLVSQIVGLFAIFVFADALTANSLMLTMALFSAIPVIVSSSRYGRRHLWHPSPLPWQTIVRYAVLATAAVFVIDVGYDKIYALIFHSSLPAQPTHLLVSKARHDSAWLAFACVAWLLPVAEEVIFRGFLFDALRSRFSGRIVVLVTATAFSLMHFQPFYFLPLFGFGLLLGWARWKTDSLRLPVFLHVLNNSVSLVLGG